MSLITMYATANTSGIGAPQFNEGSTMVLTVINVLLVLLAIGALWKANFGKVEPTKTVVTPDPLMVKEHDDFVTRREFREIKARTIAVEEQLRAMKESLHATELRLIHAGNEREHKIMERIDLLVPELAKALDRTEQRKGGRTA